MRITQSDIKKFLCSDEIATAYQPAKGSTIKVVQDPKVRGTFAVRYETAAYGQIDMMFCTQESGAETAEEILDYLSEYEIGVTL
jgi:hypothetical protein